MTTIGRYLLPVSTGAPQRTLALTSERVVGGVVVLLFVVAALLHIAHLLGAFAESMEVAIIGYVLAGVAVAAGLFAAAYRRRGLTRKAVVGYRIAVWCLLVAFLAEVQAPHLRELEDLPKQLARYKILADQHRHAVVVATGAAVVCGEWSSFQK